MELRFELPTVLRKRNGSRPREPFGQIADAGASAQFFHESGECTHPRCGGSPIGRCPKRCPAIALVKRPSRDGEPCSATAGIREHSTRSNGRSSKRYAPPDRSPE